MDKQTALNTVSRALGVPVLWLQNLINFESAGNPLARNPISGARGLIQFTHETARILGFKDANDLVSKYPDYAEQVLHPVYAYFQLPGNKPPYLTPQSLYMTVFFPAARKWSELTRFPQWVLDSNPGIVLVRDYVNKVEKKTSIKKAGISIITLGGIALAAYLVYNHLQTKGALSWTNETGRKIFQGEKAETQENPEQIEII